MEIHFKHQKMIGGKTTRTFEIHSEGPISRFNTIGDRTVYLRQYSSVKYQDSKHREWDTRPELLFHRGRNSGRIEKATVVFGNRVYHYEITPAEIRGDGYKIFTALEAATKGDMGPLRQLAENWRGEARIVLTDKNRQSKLELKIHAADIQDMVERYTRLKLGIPARLDT